MKRVTMTKMGWCWVAGGIVLYAASQQAQSGLLFLVIGILFACYVINFVEGRHSLGLTLTPPETITAAEGERVIGTWTIANPGKAPAGCLSVEGPWGPFFTVGTLAPDGEAHVTPHVIFERRGIYPFSELELASAYPFGFISWRQRLACAGEVIVHPGSYPCSPPQAAGFEPMLGGNFAGQHKARTGENFHGVRPMLPEDPVKMIHWPSTSKGLGMMVREFDEQLSGRVGLVMGCETEIPEHLDWAARAAASLMLACQDSGFQLEYIELQNPDPISVPPFTDGNAFLGPLARLKPEPGTTTADHIEAAVRKLPQRAGLVFVLPTMDGAALAALDRLVTCENRKVSLYLPEGIEITGTRAPIHRFRERELLS